MPRERESNGVDRAAQHSGDGRTFFPAGVSPRSCLYQVALIALAWSLAGRARAGSVTNHPYQGVTKIVRMETSPRALRINVLQIDLTAPGLRFTVTPGSGTRETTASTTLSFMSAQHAQIGINACFYQPNSTDATRWIVGFAASEGSIYSSFEGPTPAAANPVNSLTLDQSYAIMYYAPALNIDAGNNARVVHYDASFADKKHVLEPVTLYNAISGSAQIITAGIITIPAYTGNPATGLTAGNGYSDADSWYNRIRSRTAVGLSSDNQTLTLFAVDEAGGSQGMAIGEVATMLKNDYGVYNALNLDGGGSTTLTMQDPVTRANMIINTPSDSSGGGARSVGNSLLVFAGNQAPFVTNLTASLIPGQLTLSGGTDIAGRLVTERAAGLLSPDWQACQTNPVAGGPFSFTIPLGPEPQAFFRLKGQ